MVQNVCPMAVINHSEFCETYVHGNWACMSLSFYLFRFELNFEIDPLD